MRQGFIAREGWKFVLPSLFLGAAFVTVHLTILALLSFMFFLFSLFFFRNPKRSCLEAADYLVSPADGRVMEIKDVNEGEFLSGQATRIAIFMSLASVHVNRAPCGGRVVKVHHRDGEFALAFKKDIDKENERNYVLLEHGEDKILLVQIAGFLARRITSYVKEGDVVQRGDPFGIIAFGSRVDIYIPKTCECMVQLSDRVRAGVTLLARTGG